MAVCDRQGGSFIADPQHGTKGGEGDGKRGAEGRGRNKRKKARKGERREQEEEEFESRRNWKNQNENKDGRQYVKRKEGEGGGRMLGKGTETADLKPEHPAFDHHHGHPAVEGVFVVDDGGD